jgi:hypothetical protein
MKTLSRLLPAELCLSVERHKGVTSFFSLAIDAL